MANDKMKDKGMLRFSM